MMAPLPGMLWKWVPGRAASFICLIFTPEHLPQVDAEESRAEGAMGAWVPCVKGATDTCKFTPFYFFPAGSCSAPEPLGHSGWEPCLSPRVIYF